jgi:hypothetical protein
MIKTTGQIAYEGYRNHTDGKSLATGAVIPEWDQLRVDIQQAWQASANHLLISTALVGTSDKVV